MGTLKDLIQTSPIHKRELEFTIYSLKDDQILLEGWLKDDRFVDAYTLDGTHMPPGKVHRICVRMLIGGWPLSILDAEAEMPIVPHNDCCTIQDSIKKVIGMKITTGYSGKVHKLLSGIKGCTHMVQLLVSMGNAAMQGYWSQKLLKQPKQRGKKKEFPGLNLVMNSCFLWRKDGPLVQRIKNTLKESSSSLDETKGPRKNVK